MQRIHDAYVKMNHSLSQIAESEKLSVATVTAVLDHLRIARRGRGMHTLLGKESQRKMLEAQAEYIAIQFSADTSQAMEETVLSLIEAGVILPGPSCKVPE